MLTVDSVCSKGFWENLAIINAIEILVIFSNFSNSMLVNKLVLCIWLSSGAVENSKIIYTCDVTYFRCQPADANEDP